MARSHSDQSARSDQSQNMADKKEDREESVVAEASAPTDKDVELEEEETPYPYYVFFILGNEFCERYAYYGMRSILVIFLVSQLSELPGIKPGFQSSHKYLFANQEQVLSICMAHFSRRL